LLTHEAVPIGTTASGVSFSQGHTVVATVADGDPVVEEVVPGVLAELADPVIIVSEPLVGSMGTLGVLTLALVSRTDPGEPERRFLATLAGLTAQALERAQLLEHERQALRDAESGRDRLSLLSEVTRLLSSSLEPTTVIRRTMSLVEGRLADACVVQVPGDTGLVRLDVRAGPPRSRSADTREDGSDHVPFDSDAPAAAAYRTGRTQLAPMLPGSVGADTKSQETSTALCVPLTANGEVIGVMTFIDRPGRLFEADDVSLATEVASRTGVALSNATRFQREHVVAEVLQRAVLPDSLPVVEGLRLDAEYRAGVAGAYVGGDWYDVFELGADRIFFSVGDVMGKGAPAAALMGQVRSAIRAYAVAGQSPTEVLASLDQLFDALVEDRVVTAVVGTFDPSTGRVHLSNAGHPPPLLLRSNGEASFCPMQQSLLIAAGLSGAPRPRDELVLKPGDSLIMYSDGLIERRGEPITSGMDRLATAATMLADHEWPERPAGALASVLSDEERTDDVVVLCLGYEGASEAGMATAPVGTTRDGMSTLNLEPVVESTPVARHWVAAHLRDAPADVVERAGLLTSELVTNAVLHAATALCVTLHILPNRIRVDVADGDPTFPSLRAYGRDAATGRGLTLFNTLASNWGIEAVEGGKIVWFELPVDFPLVAGPVSDGDFRFNLAGIARADLHEAGTEPVMHLRLLGIPVGLLQKSSEEYEALFRELRLMKEQSGDGGEGPVLPERLSFLVSEIGSRFHGLGPGMDEIWQEAVDQQLPAFDWSLDLPQSAAVACEFYSAMLDEVDEFGHSTPLLTMPASPTSVAVRRWFLSELIGQLHGKGPVAWSDSRFQAELQAGAQAG
jgi:anti-sigma regulatory factor (Ser/Thr protein kinase)